MHNMLIRPTAERAGRLRRARLHDLQRRRVPRRSAKSRASPARPASPSTSKPARWSSWAREYAGEMKKGVFTIMHYLMPKRGVLSMHCSANEGAARRRVAVLRPLGHRQDDALGRSAPQADRRRRALLDRPRRVQHRRGLLRQVHQPLGREGAGDLPRDPLRHGAGKRGRRSEDAARSITPTPR